MNIPGKRIAILATHGFEQSELEVPLKRLKEAGLNLLLIWPPFADVPVSKTLDDLKRLKQEIMPKVEAI